MRHHPGSFQGGFIGRPGYFAPGTDDEPDAALVAQADHHYAATLDELVADDPVAAMDRIGIPGRMTFDDALGQGRR
jgi:hypothetical protein